MNFFFTRWKGEKKHCVLWVFRSVYAFWHEERMLNSRVYAHTKNLFETKKCIDYRTKKKEVNFMHSTHTYYRKCYIYPFIIYFISFKKAKNYSWIHQYFLVLWAILTTCKRVAILVNNLIYRTREKDQISYLFFTSTPIC